MERKEEMVSHLNGLLGMKLSPWQFLQIRRFELQEMIASIEKMRFLDERFHEGFVQE